MAGGVLAVPLHRPQRLVGPSTSTNRTNPVTVEDWKRALDCTVRKMGSSTSCSIRTAGSSSEQVVQFIDYAEATYGKRVKFLSFRECVDRLNTHLLKGQPVREPKKRRRQWGAARRSQWRPAPRRRDRQ